MFCETGARLVCLLVISNLNRKVGPYIRYVSTKATITQHNLLNIKPPAGLMFIDVHCHTPISK